MKLYWVVAWGSECDADGPNGVDRSFVVRANSVCEAAALVDKILPEIEILPGTTRYARVAMFCQSIREIGMDTCSDPAARIIIGERGPAREHAYNAGRYREWLRDEPEGEWYVPDTTDLPPIQGGKNDH